MFVPDCHSMNCHKVLMIRLCVLGRAKYVVQNWEQCQVGKNIELLQLQGAVCHNRKLLCIQKDVYVVTMLPALVLFLFVLHLFL